MPDNSNQTRLESITTVLVRHGVDFIIIGGQAEYLMGSPRVTYDVDLCYRREPENASRLADALRELKASLRGVPDGVPFLLDGRTLMAGNNFTFKTAVVDLDMLGYVEPIGGFEELLKNASNHLVGGVELKTIDLDDLIRVKRHINRSKDRESLFQLLAIKRIREESAGEGKPPADV